jgi:hypothetical protein
MSLRLGILVNPRIRLAIARNSSRLHAIRVVDLVSLAKKRGRNVSPREIAVNLICSNLMW